MKRMGFKQNIFAIGLLVCGISLQAAEKAATDRTVEWQGVQTWKADSTEIPVIAFRGAAYPTEDRLPQIEISLPLTDCIPDIRIENAEFIGLKDAERQLLEGVEVPDSLQVYTFISTERYNSQLTVHINPFVRQDGTVKKLSRYRLVQVPTARTKASLRSTRHSYADNSILQSGTFVKIQVSQTGIYKLTYEDLVSMGIPNPTNVRIFGYGGGILPQSFTASKLDDLPEAAIYMNKGADNVFNAGDYILFYAQGPVKWAYDKSSQTFAHQTNVYSDYGYYFVSSDAGTGKKISMEDYRDLSTPRAMKINSFIDYQLHEIDAINLIDPDKGAEGGGREFYGEVFSNVLSRDFSFSFPNIASSSSYNKLKLSVAASSSVASNFTTTVNGIKIGTTSISKLPADTYTKAVASTSTFSFIPTSDNLVVNLKYEQSTSTSKGYLNYIEINAERALKMNGDVMFFRNPMYAESPDTCLYSLSGANSSLQIWNITDPHNIRQVNATLKNDTLQFYEDKDNLQEYVVLNPANNSPFLKPAIVGKVSNQNLHALSDIDFVIITHPTFQGAAERLAQAHREIDGMNVAVVTAEQVYNEFSSGTPDATAYRWIMKMLYDRANDNPSLRPPRYLLLFGDGSFDNRKKLSTSPQNWLLTYQASNSVSETNAYVMDDYFGFLDDSEGSSDASDKVDIGIGRFCVNSATEADNVVTKTINYMQNKSKGIWKNQLCFLGDDGDTAADGITHMQQADSVANSVGRSNKGFQINKILLDSYPQEVSASGESYPIAKNKLDNLLKNGMLLWNYTGHGGAYEITNESMMNVNMVRALTNQNLPLWSFATCSFSKFDAATVSAGEESVLNPNGGAIGMYSAARTVFSAQNMNLIKCFCDSLFATTSDGEHLRIGDAVRISKNSIPAETNKRAYNYIGDPAVRLNYPTQYNIVTETINGKPVNEPDTMRALSTVTLTGYIADKNSQLAESFNGVIQLAVYDKEATFSSMNNNGFSAGFTFVDRQSTIFSGKANVENGKFSITFMVPKDIKYNYGTGRINYYAYDTNNGEEGQGYFEDFYIGGGSDDFIEETDGPIASCYLNSTLFVSGDKVNETPLFIAFLEDENGINTSGAGIGHDLMLMIDNDPTQYYILNDAFEADEGNFRKGSVNYQLPELTEGKHTLTFRAWDLLNNSTTQILDFEVVKDLDVTIYSIKGYPNPVMQGGTFNIAITHDRPNTLLETNVYFYDLSGRLVYQQSANSSSIEKISCNLGQAGLAPGMYLYRVTIKTTDSEITTKSNKIIIAGQ